MIDIFQNHGFVVLYYHTQFGGDRMTRAGCWCESLFLFLFFVTLRVCWRAVRSRRHIFEKYCVTVYGSILMLFSPFSEAVALS